MKYKYSQIIKNHLDKSRHSHNKASSDTLDQNVSKDYSAFASLPFYHCDNYAATKIATKTPSNCPSYAKQPILLLRWQDWHKRRWVIMWGCWRRTGSVISHKRIIGEFNALIAFIIVVRRALKCQDFLFYTFHSRIIISGKLQKIYLTYPPISSKNCKSNSSAMACEPFGWEYRSLIIRHKFVERIQF